MCGLITGVMIIVGAFMLHPGLGLIALAIGLYNIFGGPEEARR